MAVKTKIKKADLQAAYDGSYYTVCGAGGPLQEWVDGYEGLLEEKSIGKPVAWYQTTGAELNAFAQAANPRDEFQDDLVILMFPLDGLNVGALAMFKLAMQDRWLDDVCDNMRG